MLVIVEKLCNPPFQARDFARRSGTKGMLEQLALDARR
jgi:hypothetical protein